MVPQVRLTNGYYQWYLDNGGSVSGRQLTTSRFVRVSWQSNAEQVITSGSLLFNLNVIEPFDFKAAGDTYVGEGFTGSVDDHLLEQRFIVPSRYNVLQEGTTIEIIDGATHHQGVIKTLDAESRGPRSILVNFVCELGNRERATAMHPDSTPDNLLPIALRSPLLQITDAELVDAPYFMDNELPGQAAYAFDYTLNPEAFEVFDEPAPTEGGLLAVAISDGTGGDSSTWTDQFGRDWDKTDEIVSDLDEAENPPWPCTGYLYLADALIPHVDEEIIRYYGLRRSGGFWAFVTGYRACCGTTATAWAEDTVIVHLLPKEIAPDQFSVKETVALTGPVSEKTPAIPSDKAGVQAQLGAFVLAEPHPFLPLLATCKLWDFDTPAAAADDPDGDGYVTGVDVAIRLFTAPEDCGGMAFPTISYPTALKLWRLNLYTFSPKLTGARPALEEWLQFVRRVGLERTLGLFYDPVGGEPVIYAIGLGGTGDDLTITEGVMATGYSTSIAESYTKGFVTARDFTPYSALALGTTGHERFWLGDVEMLALDPDALLELYLPFYEDDPDDPRSDLYEYNHLPSPLGKADLMLNGSDVRFQQYRLDDWAGTPEIQRRFFRYLTDSRPDSNIRVRLDDLLDPLDIADDGAPLIFCVWTFADAAVARELEGQSFVVNSGKKGEVLAVIEGTVDPNFDPDDIRGVGINAFTYDDLEWRTADPNLLIHARGQDPEFHPTEEVTPGVQRAARALRLAFYRVAGTGAESTDIGDKAWFVGVSEIVSRVNQTRAFLTQFTADPNLAGTYGYLYTGANGAAKLFWNTRFNVGSHTLDAVGTTTAQCLLQSLLVDSWRRRASRTYVIARTTGNATELTTKPLHHGQLITITGIDGADVQTLMVDGYSRSWAYVGRQFRDTITLTAYDPTSALAPL